MSLQKNRIYVKLFSVFVKHRPSFFVAGQYANLKEGSHGKLSDLLSI